jgi:hypothetical protein
MIGAHRDNEVDTAHALPRKLEVIRKAGASINEIQLAPLSQEDVVQLITDALQCEPERVLPLVQLVYDKTAQVRAGSSLAAANGDEQLLIVAQTSPSNGADGWNSGLASEHHGIVD